ncbi:MAG TPA: DedA family protein [Gammaproteobacteria bacterium]|nr:DedA family protein [Gammaproteobacteria bacterium]
MILQALLHIDTVLVDMLARYGIWTYALLFAIIFAETGFVVTPFLPGDSLLFAAGSLAALPHSPIKVQLLFVLLTLAAILGNKVNYAIGRALGPRVFAYKKSWLFNPTHLQEAHAFYEKHGRKTIVIARFLPIIRSFAPFVAGIGRMNLGVFSLYNALSGVAWVGSLLYTGFYFGQLPLIQANFTLVIYGIILISLLPAIITALFNKKSKSCP